LSETLATDKKSRVDADRAIAVWRRSGGPTCGWPVGRLTACWTDDIPRQSSTNWLSASTSLWTGRRAQLNSSPSIDVVRRPTFEQETTEASRCCCRCCYGDASRRRNCGSAPSCHNATKVDCASFKRARDQAVPCRA